MVASATCDQIDNRFATGNKLLAKYLNRLRASWYDRSYISSDFSTNFEALQDSLVEKTVKQSMTHLLYAVFVTANITGIMNKWMEDVNKTLF